MFLEQRCRSLVHELTPVRAPFRRCSAANKLVDVSGLYLTNYRGDRSGTVPRIILEEESG